MALSTGTTRSIDVDTRTRQTDDIRINSIVRTGNDFKIIPNDRDSSTGSWKTIVLVRTAAIGFLVWMIVGKLLSFLPLYYKAHNSVVSLLGALFILVTPGVLAWGANVTNPWEAWAIATLGKLHTVKNGRIIVMPFLSSVKGILNTRENTFYVPVNQSFMRGLAGQSTIRVSLNVRITYAASNSERGRLALFMKVTEPDVALFMVSENVVTEWMRQHPFTALLETATLDQTMTAVNSVVRDKFPNQHSTWYDAFTKELLSAVYTPQDLERLGQVERLTSPSESMKVMLQREVTKWGLVISAIGISDIELPTGIAEEFERAEGIREQAANIAHALRTQFPGQPETWYRDKVDEKLSDLIRFGSGRTPQVFTRLDDSQDKEGPFDR